MEAAYTVTFVTAHHFTMPRARSQQVLQKKQLRTSDNRVNLVEQ